MKREESFILVPAGWRERKTFLRPNPRSWEQIQKAEAEAAERKRLADEKAAAEAEAFEAEKLAAEEERQRLHGQA